MGRSREIKVELQYDVNEASVRRAVQSAQTVENSLVDAQRATAQAASAARAATDQYESLGRTTGRLAQLAGALGVGPAAEALGFAADFADVAEDLAPKLAGVGAQAQALIPALAGMDAGAAGLLATLGPVALAAGAAAAAIAVVSSELQKQAQAAREYIARMEAVNEFLAQGGTSADARQRMEQARRDAAEAAMNIEQQGSLLRSELQRVFGDVFMGLDVATAPITQLASAVQDMSAITYVAAPQALEYAAAVERNARAQAEALQMFSAYGQAVMAGETAEADAAKTAEEAAAAQDDLNRHLDDLANRLGRVSPDVQKLNDELRETSAALRDAQEADSERKEAIIEVARRYTEDERRIRSTGYERLAEIEKRYADQQAQIAQQAADEAARALQRLQQQESELATSLQRDVAKAEQKARQEELQAQIDFQREEARAARAHADDLLRIQRESADREHELLLASDFRGLYLLRRDRNRQINEAEKSYLAERNERLISFQEAKTDRQAAFVAERQERLAQYQQSLADARSAYRQQIMEAQRQQSTALAQARAAHQQELAEQKAALQAQLEARRAEAIAELTLLNQTEQQRLAIQAQANAQYLALANQLISGIGAAVGKAPTLSSAITNSRSAVMNNTFNIQSGASASTVAKVVDQRIAYRLQQVMGRGK